MMEIRKERQIHADMWEHFKAQGAESIRINDATLITHNTGQCYGTAKVRLDGTTYNVNFTDRDGKYVPTDIVAEVYDR